MRINGLMPFVTLDRVDNMLDGLDGRRLLVLGACYRGGVADTRHSPSAAFAAAATARGAEVVCHDPLVTEWELPVAPVQELPDPAGFDAVVFAVVHDEYLAIDLLGWLGDSRPVVVDANHVLLDSQLRDAAGLGCRVWSIGRGDVPLRHALITGGGGFIGSHLARACSTTAGQWTCSTTSPAAPTMRTCRPGRASGGTARGA